MTASPRKPAAFKPDEPGLVLADEASVEIAPAGSKERGVVGPPAGMEPTAAPAPPVSRVETARQGIRWGAILLSAAGALASLALALSFARFVSIALERHDWIGWISFGLIILVLVSGLALILRELAGFVRLRRLGKLREAAEAALRTRDAKAEREVLGRITAPLRDREELHWALARLAEDARQIRDPGDLLRLADRELMVPLDNEARRLVAGAARRIATVSAVSPTALLTVGWVLVENLRLLRRLAGLYGGRPGFLATARLARMVFTHIIATGGVAMTDDLLGQFLGQDLLRRLSRRLGEGVFNAALTARIGAAAIEVIRPLPYLEAPRVRARDLVGDVVRGIRGDRQEKPASEPAKAG